MSARPVAVWLIAIALLPQLRAAEPSPTPSTTTEYVQVASTPIPEESDVVPASVTILDGELLRGFGSDDLRGALRLVAGIDIAEGGDAGPAASVPQMWGLREFDAFLLVVDGVPWGGAFNPELSTLSLRDVERIEIVRGAAPVMYGATSFVGVIHVIHHEAGAGGNAARIAGGSHGSADATVAFDLPSWAGFRSRLLVDGERREFADPRTSFDRGHLLFRNLRDTPNGKLRLDLDYAWLDQSPSSPHPREGANLSLAVPLDANHNPVGSFVEPRRATLNAGYDRRIGSARWKNLLSVSRTLEGSLRGFLVSVDETDPNAHGYREDISLTEIYLDSRYETTARPGLQVVAGLDHLHGQGSARGGDFDYFVPLDGVGAPSGSSLPSQAAIAIGDRRDFSGAYGYASWNPKLGRWRIEAGARLNHTRESRDASTLDFEIGVPDRGETAVNATRLTGSLGATFTAWERKEDSLRVYADYRSAFKPAAMDFGLDASPEILEPETSLSWEAGAKARTLEGRLEVEISLFTMDMNHLVVSQVVDGVPALVNGGAQRFRGAELEFEGRIVPDLFVRGSYAVHDARFRDFVQDFDGTPTQLGGNRVEMSPRDLAALGVLWSRSRGFRAHMDIERVGPRYLNKRNTALAAAYTTWAAGVGYRTKSLEYRIDGQNLSDRRPPTAESEFGDAQYYRLFPRHIEASVRWDF